MVFDPELVQELFVTKNQQTEKCDTSEIIFKDLLGNSFLFGKGDKIWKAKRKAVAHAFYKDQLKVMMEVLKSKIDIYFDIWHKEIEASPEKSHKIDIT